MKHSVLKSTAGALGLFALSLAASTAALAGPTYTFSTSTGVQPSNVGIITINQVSATQVGVNVDLLNSDYGFLNTGSHTPFAFNLAGSGALSAVFSLPVGGSYTNSFGNSGIFSLNTAGGSQAGMGTFNVAIDNSAGNGSSKAYYGDLTFTLTRVGGLSTVDFIAIGSGFYFSADLTDGSDTGSQGWSLRQGEPDPRDPGTPVPEPLTMSLFAAGLAGIAGLRRRKNLQLA